MRQLVFLTLLASAGVLCVASCSGEPGASGAGGATGTASLLENAAGAGASNVQLTLGCDGPFTPDATPATLAQVFGAANVVSETIDGPEGMPLNVTAIYPNDPARRIEVTFRNEEDHTGLMSATLRGDTSLWTGPGGLKLGQDLAAVETANGASFQLTGFGWDYGGYVTNWNGGKLDQTNDCAISVRMSPEAVEIAPEIEGDGVQPSSDAQAVRDAKPHVTTMGIGWVH